MLDEIHFYSPETTLFPELAARFGQTGQLTAEELYLILDWKAARARTRHLRRLTDGRTFSQAAADLGRVLYNAPDDEDRLKLLLAKPWSFALPTATAILAVLYPERCGSTTSACATRSVTSTGSAPSVGRNGAGRSTAGSSRPSAQLCPHI